MSGEIFRTLFIPAAEYSGVLYLTGVGVMHTNSMTAISGVLPVWKMTVPDRPLTGLTILVVEDSSYASEALRLLCLRSGARIRRADSLKAAHRHLRTYRPEVTIIDLGLPDGDGVDLIRSLDGSSLRIPVILAISGNPDLRDAAFAAGADAFLAKPIENLGVFQQAILQALPENMRNFGPTIVPDSTVTPDESALHQDFRHAFTALASNMDDARLTYLARFLAGVARSARDEALEAAAIALAPLHEKVEADSNDIEVVSAMLEQRLSRASIL